MSVCVPIVKLRENAQVPTRGSLEAAGWDLYSNADVALTIEPHTTMKIPTGISIAIPKGYFGGIYARSGLATKRGLRPANCCGVIDSDYRGEVIVALHNDTNETQRIEAGERIAQLIIQPYYTGELTETDIRHLGETARGTGSFGSTGTL